MKYTKIWEVADAPIFEMTYGTVNCISDQMMYFGFVSEGMILYGKNLFLEAWYSENDFEAAYTFSKKFFGKTEKVIKLLKTMQEALKEKEISIEFEDLRGLSNEQIFEIMDLLSKKQSKTLALFNITNPQFTHCLEEELKKNIEDNSVIIEICKPQKISTLQKERLAYLKVLVQIILLFESEDDISAGQLKQYNLEKPIRKIAETYGYLSGNEGADKWDFEFYVNQLRKDFNSKKENVDLEIKKLQSYEVQTGSHRKKLIKKYKIDEKNKYTSRLLSELGYYRLELRHKWSFYYSELRKLIYFLSKRLEIPAYDLMTLEYPELKDFVLKEKKIVFSKRSKAYLYEIKKHTVKKRFFGQKADFYYSENLKQLEEEKEILYGEVAFKGEVKGKAYTFNWNDENFNKKIEEMPEGSIIVIGNTRPSLMPAIRKAAGIITDEGGITSHAAIVSRELELPCIINSKIATKVIKTGDEILLNAEKGEISITKKI